MAATPHIEFMLYDKVHVQYNYIIEFDHVLNRFVMLNKLAFNNDLFD